MTKDELIAEIKRRLEQTSIPDVKAGYEALLKQVVAEYAPDIIQVAAECADRAAYWEGQYYHAQGVYIARSLPHP